MDEKNKIILAMILVICMVGTISVTYLVMDNIKTVEIKNLKTEYDDKIGDLVDTIINHQLNIFDLEENITLLTRELNTTLEKLEETNASLEEYIQEVEYLQNGDRFYQHNPTYNEVALFIARDKTDEIPFDFETFDCENYALEVNNNAEEIGIRCAVVVMYFEGTDVGHAIVGFETVDRGMVYVEPQTDDWVENLEIGNDYWTDCVVPGGKYIYTEDPNDTIKEILIYW